MRPEVLGFPIFPTFPGSSGGDALLVIKGKGWQRGLLNGLGGGINPGEDPREAMVREAHEEARLVTAACEWQPFARLLGGGFDVRVYCYRVGDCGYATINTHQQAQGRIDVTLVHRQRTVARAGGGGEAPPR